MNKNGKASCQLMNNAAYRETMKNLRNRIDEKLVNNEKDYENVPQNQAIYR